MGPENIKKITLKQQDYPKLLRQIHSPPDPLYNRGILRNDLFPIAVVGSRKMTEYGKQAVELIISGLKGLPVSIISGMAYGIDAESQNSALKHGLHTVAVLGSGIDDLSIYPRENLSLAKRIISGGGAIISEYPERTSAMAYHFPNRNRIISGMSKAVAIIEADQKSGSLITAEHALDQGRDVFAVPGSIFQKSSSGANALIVRGAIPLRSATDIISLYPSLQAFKLLAADRPQSDAELSPVQQKVFGNIGFEPTSLEFIFEKTKLSLAEINSALTMLELAEKIRACGDCCYIRNLTN